MRKYGQAPFNVVVVHGGPGGAGEMQPVAQELSNSFGVIEPHLLSDSLEGQIGELRDAILFSADHPVTLLGHSFGAMLSVLVAARHPELVKKLILVGSGSMEPGGGAGVMGRRLERLSEEEREELKKARQDPEKNFQEATRLIYKADHVDPLPYALPHADYAIFSKVWAEAQAFRESGQWLEALQKVACPIVIIHGDADPPPITKGYRQILLKNCGHCPWNEKQAKETFYKMLTEEIS